MKLIIKDIEMNFENPEQLLNKFFFLTEEEQKECRAIGLTPEVLDFQGILDFDREYRLDMFIR